MIDNRCGTTSPSFLMHSLEDWPSLSVNVLAEGDSKPS